MTIKANPNEPIIVVLVVVALIMVLMAPSEPHVDDMYPTTRYERCMVLYGDTVDERLCDKESKTPPRP